MIKNIGCHLSSSGGFAVMAKTAESIGANTFQYFSRNPRGGKAKVIDSDDLEKFLEISKINNFKSIVAHAPYTMNLCSSNERIRNFSAKMLSEDLESLNKIPNAYYNFHPGSHTGQGISVATEQISIALNNAMKPEQSTTVLLETMAGKGSEVGGKFEDIAQIIKQINLKDKIGVCFDTCHVYDAGYDIVNNLDGVLEEFDKKVGISKLKAVHLNDSKNLLGSKKDRHEQLGKGNIGLKAIFKIVQNKYLKDLVFILETPQESLQGYKAEIEMLRSQCDL